MPASRSTQASRPRVHGLAQHSEDLTSSARFSRNVKGLLAPPSFLRDVDLIHAALLPSVKKTNRAKDYDSKASSTANCTSLASHQSRNIYEPYRESFNPFLLNCKKLTDPLRSNTSDISTAHEVRFIKPRPPHSIIQMPPKRVASGPYRSKRTQSHDQPSHHYPHVIWHAQILDIGSQTVANNRIRRIKHFNHAKGGPRLPDPGTFEVPA